jgi:hypothetical protein
MTSNYLRSSSARYKSQKKIPPSEKNTRSWETTFKVLAAFISLAGVSLTLLGYGSSLALTDTFGLDVTDVYRSPVDFLLASKDVIVVVIDRCSKMAENQDFNDLWFWLYGSFTALICFTFYSVCKLFLRSPSQRTRIVAGAVAIRSSIWSTFKKYNLDYPLVALSTMVIPWLSALGVLFAIRIIVVAVAIFPTWGFFAGRWAAEESIVKPLKCQSYKPSKPGSKSTDGAICLRVINKDGKEIARGRRIARTADQVFLYNKATRQTSSIPTRDSIIEQVESE